MRVSGVNLRDVVFSGPEKQSKSTFQRFLKTAILGLSVGSKQGYTGPQKGAELAQILRAKFADFADFARARKRTKNDHKERQFPRVQFRPDSSTFFDLNCQKRQKNRRKWTKNQNDGEL